MKIVFIIGMHRCGTSLISNCLVENGFTIGETKNNDKDWQNPNGYFENDSFGDYHNHLLSYNSSTWSNINNETMLYTKDHVNEYRELIKEEFPNDSLILIKDPRLTFFIDFLKEVCKGEHEPYFIFCTRDKVECCQSLSKAQNIPLEVSEQLYEITHSKFSNEFLRINHKDLLFSNRDTVKKIGEFCGFKLKKDVSDIVNLDLYRNRRMSKNCKIIATYFGPRRNKPNGVDETIEFWESNVLKYECEVDPGVDMDTIIINHDFGDEKVKEYLKTIDGKQTKRGVIRVYNREWEDGIGGSFASFNKGFEVFINDYDYWFFTEDNVIMVHDGYYELALNQLNKSGDAFICCMRAGGIKHKNKHCDGACGLTSKKILTELHDRLGNLPYSKEPIDTNIQEKIKLNDLTAFKSVHSEVQTKPNSWYHKFCYEGEVKFTNELVKFGYNISELECDGIVAMWHEHKY